MQKGLLFIMILLMVSCRSEKKEFKKLHGSAFGTTYSITYQNNFNLDFNKQIDSIIYVMNKSLSTYMPNSDISKINDGDESILIDANFNEVFKKSDRIFKQTNGFFDPTVGPLVNAWGFGPEKAINDLSTEQVDSLMQFVGFDKVKTENGAIVKATPEIYFDFNAIAKGFGIDLIGRFLESKGCEHYLIELGGEIRARGINKDGNYWKVAIEDPNIDGSRSFSKITVLENQSMASSGNYRKFNIDANGRKFVHTINPTTGYAVESDLLSATVISKLDCADVDAYATAFMAMGLEQSKAFLEKHSELDAHLIYTDASGEIKTFSTKNLKLTLLD
ncbi:MAG: thiamine biosynthesis protein ApbE [Bacteroidetes bacterium MedPE-SWsnd-G1]|nr:MAG: thiamine biosynthesis protein ApbE [Bacteroidetes bacterium MedPE-SWsnd-G1]